MILSKEAVRVFFKDTDLCDLIKQGAPDDEYDSESDMIFKSINRCASINELSERIKAVFVESFSLSDHESDLDYFSIASKIWSAKNKTI